MAMHTEDSIVPGAFAWAGSEQALPLGGEGCPRVAEFALVELAALLGRTFDSARLHVARAVELRYRLPRLHARVAALEVVTWRALQVADATLALPPDGAAWVDRQVAPFAGSVGPAQLERLVREAMARFDPVRAEEERLAAAETRHATLHRDDVTGGTVGFTAEMDLADGLDLDAALDQGAAQLAALGSPDTHDVRRSVALGEMARDQLALALSDGSPDDRPAPRPRRVVIHAHLSEDLTLATIERPDVLLSVEQVASWCADRRTQVTITPVVDLAEERRSAGYAAPPRLREQVILRDGSCVFPHCQRPARTADLTT
ncbi:13E12 repeat family protein [Nocardioides panacisoli]|uniref:13E12 repeat family protein n=1 Tax=Nocardioides panacisoli TaxID=627624 RepID=UPI001C62DA35|nr:13E12 repeat family protein [Nocardioides panacisoli]QYJ04112.1 13E12 repeat family protein [Nocardioides panacisoli]